MRGQGAAWSAWLVDAAAVVTAWAVLLLAENVGVGLLWNAEFAGPWEIALARHAVVPIALAALAPASLLVVGGWRLATRAAAGFQGARRALAMVGALAAAAIALGVSNGRHFANLGVRAAFVGAMAVVGTAVGMRGVPRLAALARRPLVLATTGLTLAVAGWLVDAYVLPRLYAAFHAAMIVSALLGAALVALAERAGSPSPGRVPRVFAAFVGLVVLVCAASARRAARGVERATNMRFVLVEHAPLLGRTVAMTMRLWPQSGDGGPGASTPIEPGEVARALDWTGRDILLLSVDALRADHVSAYGYARLTTPNLDALAREGTLFESAYCPTPHTSYSLTSMMTGKYLRPLLALGLGEDSETWAQDLRRYGWRTAAFYPPAVFFIDQDRFSRFELEHLGFEYAKVEFADPALRERQVAEYLDGVPAGRPLFLWVHFFEPHEPYVPHANHVFSGGPSPDVDAYDGEVAEADDGVGRIARLVRARRPGTVLVTTADHGEEFGEHGGRYHGTTVYEEQVRVPLVVVGPGVRQGERIATVVQTIDLLPTVLSALGIPRPARVRGRDLGPLLSGAAKAGDDGVAWVETDDYALVASGADRLVCQRRAAACALYRPTDDPLERRDLAPRSTARLDQLRSLLKATELDQGRYETAGRAEWPEAIRRGLQGEVDAAPDVASLLDDADVTFRRKAAEVCFELHAPVTAPEVAHALAHDEDDEVRKWSALALVRVGERPAPLIELLLHDPSPAWRRRAALALAERSDARSCDEVSAWWEDVAPRGEDVAKPDEPPQVGLDLAHAEELLLATTKARCRSAVPALVRALRDVRVRPYVVDALGGLGDDRARGALLALLADEPYVTTRPHEARALLALGIHDWVSAQPAETASVTLATPGPHVRVVALLSDPQAKLDVSADGGAPSETPAQGEVRTLELPGRMGRRVHLDFHASTGGVLALWLVSSDRLD
jgi:hypothetical protein